MAQINGYVYVPHGSYAQWKSATWGNGYDVDRYYKNQCWDFCALLWHQYGLILYTKSGGGGAADCWIVSKDKNAVPPFKAITGKENIKKGDILVWNRSRVHSNGHIGFADENYNPNKSTIACYGQNQTKAGSSAPVSIVEQSYTGFLGIFRNTNWSGDEPTPEPSPASVYNRSGYNFVLFNRRKRQEKWTGKPLNKR